MNRLAALAVLVAATSVAVGLEEYYDFTGQASDDWNDPNNWTLLSSPWMLPESGAPAMLPPYLLSQVFIRDGQTATVSSGYYACYAMSNPGLVVGGYAYRNADLELLWRDKGILVIEDGAVLTPLLEAGAVMYVGQEYSGQVIQNGGINELGDVLYVGYGGSYTYNGMKIPDPNDPNTLIQDPNYVGITPAATYHLKGGTVWATWDEATGASNPRLYVGYKGGSGTFLMDGGTLLRRTGPSGGTWGCAVHVGLGGGTYDPVSDATRGTFIMNGGCIINAEDLTVGESAGDGYMEIRNNSFADHEALVIGIGTNNPGVLTTTTTGVLIIEDNATCHFDRLYMGADGGVGSLTIKDNATVVFGGQTSPVNSWVGRNRIHAGGTTCVGGEATVNIEGGSVAFRPPMGNTGHGTFYLGWTGARGPLDPNLLLDVPPSIGVINMSGGVFTIEAGGTVASSWQVLALGASESNSRKMNPTGILNVTGGEFRTIGYTGQDPNDPNVTVRAPVHVILASSPESTGRVYVGRDATFRVDGNFLMKPGDKTGASAKLTVEIGTPTSALLQIADSAKLADTLRVECVGGYRPREGDLFTIVATGAGVTGGFDVITTNLTLGNAGFDGAVDGNAYNVTFTGLTAGDTNGDQSIDGGDLALMGGNWLRSGVTWTGADFNGDGEVDGGDLALMGGNWMWLLSPAPSQGVPEPATLALLALGGLALLRRKSA